MVMASPGVVASSGEEAVVDDRDAVGDGADDRVVGHDDEGAVLSLRQVAEQLEDLPAGLRVEVRGRLVGEEEGRRAGEGARDGDPLLLPAREVAREVRLPVGEADGVEDPLGFAPGGLSPSRRGR